MHYSHVCQAQFAACREGNPVLPRSAVTMDYVEAAVTGEAIIAAFGLRRHHSKIWRLPLWAEMGAHTFGFVWAIHVRNSLAHAR
ncbi:MAG: hypothetical protein ACRD1E_00695 [Terriglobales bacterium]